MTLFFQQLGVWEDRQHPDRSRLGAGSVGTLAGGFQAVRRYGGAPAARCGPSGAVLRVPGAGIRVWSAWRTAS